MVNGVVYEGSFDSTLYAIDINSGKQRWRFQTNGPIDSSPVVVNGVVYIGSNDHNLYALDAESGNQKWVFKTNDLITSSPTVNNGIVYVGSWDGNLYAIDARTGKLKWTFPTGTHGIGNIISVPTVANVLFMLAVVIPIYMQSMQRRGLRSGYLRQMMMSSPVL